jgi:hypothetical protein
MTRSDNGQKALYRQGLSFCVGGIAVVSLWCTRHRMKRVVMATAANAGKSAVGAWYYSRRTTCRLLEDLEDIRAEARGVSFQEYQSSAK